MNLEPAESPPLARFDATRLFLLGFLTLFLELVLIRYLAGNIWNLGYFPNLVLLAVFLGMALGFLLHHYVPSRLSPWFFQGSVLALLLLVTLVKFLSPTFPGLDHFGGEIGGEVYFSMSPKRGGTWSYLLFGFWFLSVVSVFAFLSLRTARLFRLFRPLKAYSLDICGSCCGILCFMLLSWLRVPAYAWYLVALPVFIFASPPSSWKRRILPALPFALIVMVAMSEDSALMIKPGYEGEIEVYWSPYQKVEYGNNPAATVARWIFVNGVIHQSMLEADQVREKLYPAPHEARRKAGREPYRTVLIIGAGAGNDVAAALMYGAEHVDAVEIDPVIADLGRRHHPARPYDDPRVDLIVDDGRAFMTRTERRYDLIVFALTDSLVRVSSLAQLRLENYLFTEDSIRQAQGLLTPTGDIVLYNDYRREWLIEKYQRMMHAATGKYPLTIYRELTSVALLVGRQTASDEPPEFTEADVEVPTDDWPFPYLRKRTIPTVYLGALGAVSLLILGMAYLLHRLGRKERGAERPRGVTSTHLAFTLMGVAFLLLETKSIVQFSLLFGTTWLNTSLVFVAVLVLVLAANWCALLLRQRSFLPAAYLLLIASCLFGYFYPMGNLLGVESGLLRFVFASLMTFSPIFFANLVFSIAFRDQPVAEHVFGWNLLGASAGGLLEYTSMAIGYGALAIVVALCYTLVVLCLVAARRAARGSNPGTRHRIPEDPPSGGGTIRSAPPQPTPPR